MMSAFFQILAALTSTVAFSVLFAAPAKELWLCGLSGVFTWGAYTILTLAGLSDITASLIATFLLTLLARTIAVRRQVPVTVYLITGVFQLVPGAGIYYTAYYLFTGNTALAGSRCLYTFEIAIAIVFGILFGSALPQKWFRKISPTKN